MWFERNKRDSKVNQQYYWVNDMGYKIVTNANRFWCFHNKQQLNQKPAYSFNAAREICIEHWKQRLKGKAA